jgi:DNA-directed RNA polymerase specialized sigma24 family protein
MQDVPLGMVKYRMHEVRRRLKKEMIPMVEDVLRGMVIW